MLGSFKFPASVSAQGGRLASGILWPKISPEPSTDRAWPAGRRERQRWQMRERLLSAALDLFAANGFADTTIDQIAERADVARQTVLNYFAHKTDFAKAWGQGRRDQLAAVGAGIPGGASARALVHRYFAAAAEINERERDLTRALLGSLTPTEVFLYVRAVPAAVIERGQQQGEFSPAADPGVWAEILTSVYFGTVSRWLIDGPPPFDLAQALAQRLEFVLAGLQTG
jgi:TetR/AcrR family transcriptional regulator, cholesterol catabolism regulator